MSLDILPIRFNDVLIPIKAPLPNSSQIPWIGLVTIHIHQPITLLVAIQPTQYIRKRPYAVADEVNAITDSLLTLLNMGAQIRNSILVVHSIIRLQNIKLTETIFRNQYWQLIAARHTSKS